MDFSSQIARMLHDEHITELARFERLQRELLRQGPSNPPSEPDGSLTALLINLAAEGAPSARHFDFEEVELFPRLAAQGETAIGSLLSDEHVTIREIGDTIATLAGTARRDGFTAESWREFHRLGVELTERTISHIHKEEMGLLPMVEDMLEEDEDSQLAMAYMATR